MTKQTDDLIARIEGCAVAMKGVKVSLSPPAPTAPPEATPPPVEPEAYEHAKKVIADMKSALEALEAEVARESKVPEHGSAEGKAKSKI